MFIGEIRSYKTRPQITIKIKNIFSNMKALDIRASFSITRLKLKSRGERRIRSCSWRDQLYLSVIVWKLKATRDLFLVLLICIVCTRKCKEFNHKRTVRTQGSRFKFVQSPFTADFQRQRMQSQTETGEIIVRTWPYYIATKPLGSTDM